MREPLGEKSRKKKSKCRSAFLRLNSLAGWSFEDRLNKSRRNLDDSFPNTCHFPYIAKTPQSLSNALSATIAEEQAVSILPSSLRQKTADPNLLSYPFSKISTLTIPIFSLTKTFAALTHSRNISKLSGTFLFTSHDRFLSFLGIQSKVTRAASRFFSLP